MGFAPYGSKHLRTSRNGSAHCERDQLTTEEHRFITCPPGDCFDENHLVINSACGRHSLCGKVVTRVVHYSPRGLTRVTSRVFGLAIGTAMLPLRLARAIARG